MSLQQDTIFYAKVLWYLETTAVIGQYITKWDSRHQKIRVAQTLNYMSYANCVEMQDY